MDKTEYNNKIQELLNDGSYTKIKRDPTNSLVTKTNKIISDSTALIDEIKQFSLKPSAARPPRLYGLPKIHKEDTPLRPIVSTISSPTYKLARFLADILQTFTGKTTSAVLNSTHLVSTIKGISLPPNDLLVSFDVVSLFTKVPVPDTIAIIEDLVHQGLHTDVPPLVRHCLTNTYFTWNGTFYKQTEGTPMGSPLSPVVANVFMEKFETDAIQTATLRPTLWKRYVDDTFVIWPHGQPALDQFRDHINSIHPAIRFSMEVEKDGKLPFLDVLIKRRHDGSMSHSVYRKATHTDAYLKPDSHHHPSQKNSLIKTLYHRAQCISDQEHITSELKHVHQALRANGYSDYTIRKAITPVMKKDPLVEPLKTITLPYIAGVTKKISKILNKHKIQVRFNTVHKIRDLVPSVKDAVPDIQYPGVYKLKCLCGSSYIGETKRHISDRIREHKADLKHGRTNSSAVADHCYNSVGSHDIDFSKTEVLCKPTGYHERFVHEAIHIYKHRDNFNREDGFRLSNHWKDVLNHFCS
ncbi:uncharacterized protein LOC142924610 [Petromyzon marinus]|uniref:uncharacterized protein LOC142924610 n=1 Tax=Petromyzon marinus TaxID=7757 RepID=UPI003F70DA6C